MTCLEFDGELDALRRQLDREPRRLFSTVELVLVAVEELAVRDLLDVCVGLVHVPVSFESGASCSEGRSSHGPHLRMVALSGYGEAGDRTKRENN